MSKLVLIDSSFDVVCDIRYASDNNVTKQRFYNNADCYLHQDAIPLLQKAIDLAAIQGYKIKIFDGFRPLQAQKFLFNKFPDNDFVSNPENGSIPHCRGIAIDLTLLDKSNEELDMGTDFDDFTDKAHHGNLQISKQAQKNRFILLGIMMSAGFDFYDKEWWHYQLFNPRSYDIL